ncbi:tRNA (N6-isopentenyl adenosine(37)-C2)-methylthiotransferase MiaB, partial [bacterium]
QIELVREKIPELTLTTDLLVGFPTETEEDFHKTIEAVKKIEFDQSYMFRFSPREGTLGSMYPDPISEEEKLRRLSELIRVQNEITGRKPLKEIGKKKRVLIYDRAKKGGMLGRDETGKLVVVDRGKPGEVVEVVIEKVSGWTPVGRALS